MMFVPALIRRILMSTAMAAAAIVLFWAQRDWASALVFAGAVGWAMANLLVWSAFAYILLRLQTPDKGLLLLCIGLAKLLLFGVGLGALMWAAPLTRVQLAAVIGGVTLTLFVTLLMALGARLLGREEMSDGEESPAGESASPAPELGGKF